MGLASKWTTSRTVAVLRIFTLLWAFLYGSHKNVCWESWKDVPLVPALGKGTTNVYKKRCKTTTHDSKNETLNIGRKEGGQAYHHLRPYYNPLQLENLSRKTFLPLRKEQECHENTMMGSELHLGEGAMSQETQVHTACLRLRLNQKWKNAPYPSLYHQNNKCRVTRIWSMAWVIARAKRQINTRTEKKENIKMKMQQTLNKAIW